MIMSNEQNGKVLHFPKQEEPNASVDIGELRRLLEEKSVRVITYTDDDPRLVDMNNKHIFINNMGGNNYITDKIYSEATGQEELTFLKIESFRNIYKNETTTTKITLGSGNTKVISVSLGDFWLQHAARRTVAGVIFDPNTKNEIVDKLGKKYLNLWEGFACEAKQGSWRRTLKHIYLILCNGDREKFNYVVRWLAWAVQNPDKRAEVAVVFKGQKGAGKGFICTQLTKIFGKHGMSIGNREHLIGKFNGHMDRLCFLFCDEAYYPGDVKAEGVVKVLITEESITAERKHQDARTITNRLHIMMSTNNEWVIPASEDERRYFIETVSDRYAKGRASNADRKLYFDALWGEMNNGGREAMLLNLVNMELRGWHPRDHVPETAELKKQIALSRRKADREIVEALLNMLEEARLPYDIDWYGANKDTDKKYGVIGDTLWKFLFGDNTDARVLRGYATKGGPILKVLGVKKDRYSLKLEPPAKFNRTLWIFPELDALRKTWDDKFGAVEWYGDTKKEDGDYNKWQRVNSVI